MEWIAGGAAMSAAFLTYLPAYPYIFARLLLTLDWPQCLLKRGIPLVYDNVDPRRGHVIDFMLEPAASGQFRAASLTVLPVERFW